MLIRKDEKLAIAEAWWMTGNVWEYAGCGRKAEDLNMWRCLFWWAGMPID